MVIILCGFMGSGKSFLVRKLQNAPNEGLFLDLDDVIFSKYRLGEKNLGELIEKRGWEYFREKEYQCLREVLHGKTKDGKSVLLSLGGGALSERSLTLIESMDNSYLIWLESSFEKCFERILREGEEKRPLLKKGKGYIHKLYLERKVLYSRSFLKLPEVERESLETLGSLMELINQRREESE
mgnify:FL=1